MIDRPQKLSRYRLLIVCATLLSLGRLIGADFLNWDDSLNIWHNPAFNPPTWAGIAVYWSHAAYGLYIPVTYTVWGLLAFAGYVNQPDPSGSHLNPYLYHATNVFAHVGAALLLFELFIALDFPALAAWIGALVFALHPVQVEAVGWTAGLKDVLAGTLGLAALVLYVRAAEPPRLFCSLEHESKKEHRATRCLIYLAATFCIAAAMLSKPSALVVAPMALGIDRFLLRRSWGTALRWTAPWLAMSIACAIVGRLAQPGTGVTPAPLWERPLVMADTVAFYAGKLIWPAHLCLDYGRTPAVILETRAIAWTWLVALLIVLLLLRFGDRRLWTGALLVAIGIGPTSGAVTFLMQYYSTVSDHYLYIAMIGVAMIAAQIVVRAGPRVVPLALAALLALSVRTALQAGYWHDDIALFEHTIQINPRSFMAWSNAGIAYTQRDPATAERYFRKALELKPNYVNGHNNLAGLLAEQGRFNEAIDERLAQLRDIMALPPELRVGVVDALNALVDAQIEAGRIDDAKKYQALAEAAAPKDPIVRAHQQRLSDKTLSPR